jgi:hypothetical protein
MRDFVSFRGAALRYWERRRIVYNLALVSPALFSWALTDVLNYAGDPHKIHYLHLLLLFGVAALAANICYSLAYGLEFVFGSDDPACRWLRFGRNAAFVGGVLFAVLLALVGGWNIANLEYNDFLRHAR